jgi:pimeloyl-ACP methyl ester carboxylesterase
VLDALEIERAHVIGISLGGMIAQELALAAPERVRQARALLDDCGRPDAVPMPEKTVALMGRSRSSIRRRRMRLFVENALSPMRRRSSWTRSWRTEAANPPTARGGTRRRRRAAHDAWIGSARSPRRRSSSTARPTTSWTPATRR